MPPMQPGSRFLETTRGRVVGLLRRGRATVEELARALGLTNNAIRSHLATLERDGLVRADGVRRGPGAGKPAVVYDLHPEAEPLLSRAYPPVLTAVLDVIVAELPADEAAALLGQVGRRLAATTGAAGGGGSLPERVHAAAALLTSLGGEVEVVEEEGGLRLRGWACPLSATVARRPELCRAVKSLVSEVAGAPARQCCEHGDRPRCCFTVDSAA